MKPEELRGRELAAWIGGVIDAEHWQEGGDMRPISKAAQLGRLEIERLCAERGEHDCLIAQSAIEERAARDAAALDEIRMLVGKTGSGVFKWMFNWEPERGDTSDVIAEIIERTGRKVGSP